MHERDRCEDSCICGSFSNVSNHHMQGVLDAWLSLWQWVFQPAIGVLMLGAVRASLLLRLMSIESVQSAIMHYDALLNTNEYMMTSCS
jgi:hypothetical protein